MFRTLKHIAIVCFLTALTQIGGVIWLLSLCFKRHLIVFFLLYAATTTSLQFLNIAPGRIALSCVTPGPLQIQSWFYCATNRNFVTPDLADVLHDAADGLDQAFPGTTTLVLDANFPFLTGFPLPPHLSHNDGKKADLAFFYENPDGFANAVTRSPIGYFAFEQGRSDCPDNRLTMRWDLNGLQPLWKNYTLEEKRMRHMLNLLKSDPRVEKIFVEPHLQSRLGVSGGKIRFQGCRAARHDDHIHLQI